MSATEERTFGVEIECGHGNGAGYVNQRLDAKGVPVLSVGRDGSGVEVRTRVLQGTKGFKELNDVFRVLNEIGCYVTYRDGQHVHFGGAEFHGELGTPARARLIESFVNNRHHILPFVDPYRHKNGTNCGDQWTRLVETNKHVEAFGAKGWDINLANLKRDRGTIEVRLHEGNLEYEKAEAWITFWLNFLNAIAQRSTVIPAFSNVNSLFRSTKTREATKQKLLAAAEGYKTKTIRNERRESNFDDGDDDDPLD